MGLEKLKDNLAKKRSKTFDECCSKVNNLNNRNNLNNIKSNNDSVVACNIVRHIFRYAGICLKEDKSKVKINMFARGIVSGILKDSVRDGLEDFVKNMNDDLVSSLINDIEKEIAKRKG